MFVCTQSLGTVLLYLLYFLTSMYSKLETKSLDSLNQAVQNLWSEKLLSILYVDIIYIILAYQKYLHCNTYDQWIQKLFINAHIFTMRPLDDRNQKRERFTRIQNSWPGHSWSSLGFLSTTLNIKAPLSTIRLKSLQNPRHTSQGPPKLFLVLGRQNKMALFIQGHSAGWDNPRC